MDGKLLELQGWMRLRKIQRADLEHTEHGIQEILAARPDLVVRGDGIIILSAHAGDPDVIREELERAGVVP